jgi:heavy metal sensor kinase
MLTRLRQLFPLSIRLQLTTWYTLVFVLLLLATGLVFYQYLETSLEAGVDDALQLRAQQIAGDVIVKQNTVTLYRAAGDLPGFGTATNAPLSQPVDVNYNMLVRLLDAHGKVIGATPAFRSIQAPAISVSDPLHGIPWQGTLLDRSGKEVRLYSRVLTSHGQVVAVIQVGQSLAQLHDLLHELVIALFLVGGIVLLICAFLSYILAARAFAPIRRLARIARRITDGDLHQRVPIPAPHDEIRYLALTLNEMISSLDQAFTRQQRFVSDASHELRTPVAVIRNKAGIALLGTPVLQDTVATLQDIRSETERLSALINDLLLLAHGDEGKNTGRYETVFLDQVVEAVIMHITTLATEKNIRFTTSITPSLPVLGDEARLIQVVLNLLDNAIHYTNANGSIFVCLDTTATQARLIVRDTGIGIAESDLPHIFERFYRADPARQHTQGNSTGLGLSIVEWIVRLHHGIISVESKLGQGTTFTVLLPLASSHKNASA